MCTRLVRNVVVRQTGKRSAAIVLYLDKTLPRSKETKTVFHFSKLSTAEKIRESLMNGSFCLLCKKHPNECQNSKKGDVDPLDFVFQFSVSSII